MTKEEAPADGSGREADRFDALDITLTFELAQRSVPLGELKVMGPGHVFDLGLDPRESVDLCANGVRIGRGEIIEIGERIGVRVLRLFDRGRSS